MMMCRQRVAATKIDTPLTVWKGGAGKVCEVLQFLLAHRTGDVATMHTGGEKSFSARDRVRDLRGMARVACFTMNANSSHPPPTPTSNSFTDLKSNCDSHLSK
jgi:hypothetical protein